VPVGQPLPLGQLLPVDELVAVVEPRAGLVGQAVPLGEPVPPRAKLAGVAPTAAPGRRLRRLGRRRRLPGSPIIGMSANQGWFHCTSAHVADMSMAPILPAFIMFVVSVQARDWPGVMNVSPVPASAEPVSAPLE